MRRVFAIAGIAIRSAMRSKIVVLLLGLLLVALVGIPLTVKGDGTIAGYVQILLRYTIGFVSVILSLSTLWAGCAAVSIEIQEHQIQLVTTKPVRRWQIWLGKWLGLVALNGVLLLACAIAAYGLLRWKIRPENLTSDERTALREQILTSRVRLRHAPVAVEKEAQKELEHLKANGALPPDMPESEALKAIRENLRRKAYAVSQGDALTWFFPVPAGVSTEHPLLLRYRLASSDISFAQVRGVWTVGRARDPQRHETMVKSVPGVLHALEVPASAMEGEDDLVVIFSNMNDTPTTVVFNPDDGLQVLVYGGSFEANYVRAFLALFLQLAFLAALGVTLGSLFSMPVAAFAAFCLVILIQASGYIHAASGADAVFSGHGETSTAILFWNQFFRVLFTGIDAVVRPLQGPNVLDLLADGQRIGWTWIGTVFATRILLYCGVLALVSGWILNRREMALPAA